MNALLLNEALIHQVQKYLSVFLISMLKFVGGPIAGNLARLSWVETAIFTTLGMMTSVVLFSFLGETIRQRYPRLFRRRRLFTRRNRQTVRIWRKYGLAGVAFCTPLLLTPIGGTLVAASFGESRWRIFFYMLVSAIVWSVAFSLLGEEIRILLRWLSTL